MSRGKNSFYSYVKYQKCFDWAYGDGVRAVECTELIDNGGFLLTDNTGKAFCVN